MLLAMFSISLLFDLLGPITVSGQMNRWGPKLKMPPKSHFFYFAGFVVGEDPKPPTPIDGQLNQGARNRKKSGIPGFGIPETGEMMGG